MTLAAGVEGTYSYVVKGSKATVGYLPCGALGDPSLTFYAQTAAQGRGPILDFFEDSVAALNASMVQWSGFGLTAKAVAVLNEDAATLTCTG